MKSIKQQYIDLTEGKMSQFNFMRNLRMSMPQVTNVTSFGDAVKILKNKGIITESTTKEKVQEIKFTDAIIPIKQTMNSLGYKGEYDPVIEEGYIFTKDLEDGVIEISITELNADEEQFTFTAQYFPKIDKAKLFGLIKKKVIDYRNGKLMSNDVEIIDLGTGMFSLDKPGVEDLIKSMVKRVEEKAVATKGIDENYDYNRVGTGGYDNVSEEDKEGDNDAEFDAILKQLEDEMAGEIAVKSDVLDKPLEEINEGKEPIAVDENLEEVTLGISMEHECFPAKSYDEIEKMVKKNIKKNPQYYTNYKLTGIRDYFAQTMDSSKPEDHQMKFYTEKTAVDTARGMKKIKMPKKEEKKKLKENVDEKMRFQDLPADPEKYKIVRDSKNYIIKATNADGVEFQKGDTAKTYDGEEIKIAKFEESQGKVKAIYNKGMFFASIDIDGLEAGKPEFRPGVNLGGSMEKLKNMVREIMKEMESADQEIDDMAMVMDEYFDGRDNLTNISDDTK